MNIQDARSKLLFVKQKLQEIKEITHIDSSVFEDNPETGTPHLEATDSMEEVDPAGNAKLQEVWTTLQKAIPAGFSMDGNLIRHLSFNQASDWVDISERDVPREIGKLEEYEKQLALVEYLETLRPEVSRVAEIVLNGDIDAALKTVYASLDAKIRVLTSAKPGESTVPIIGKAFNDGLLKAPHPEHKDSIRNFLQGVIGYYRSNIVHNNISTNRNSVNGSLSLFCLAHEAFWILDTCARK